MSSDATEAGEYCGSNRNSWYDDGQWSIDLILKIVFPAMGAVESYIWNHLLRLFRYLYINNITHWLSCLSLDDSDLPTLKTANMLLSHMSLNLKNNHLVLVEGPNWISIRNCTCYCIFMCLQCNVPNSGILTRINANKPVQTPELSS